MTPPQGMARLDLAVISMHRRKRNTDPMLGSLSNNGGPTATVPLLAGSPAINGGDDALPPKHDQRYFLRDGASDIGAFEFNGTPGPISAVSRKIHGAAGSFDIDLPLTGTSGIECRSGGGTNDYQIVAIFPGVVTFASASVTSGSGSVANATGSGTTTVTVNLTGVINAQRINVTLSSVSNGTNTGSVTIPMAILIGDATGNGTTNASDVSLTKLKSGQVVDGSNFREDVTVSGSINASDVSLVKLRSGPAAISANNR